MITFQQPRQVTPPTLAALLKPCHDEGQFLFKLGRASIHAGGMSAARTVKSPPWDLVVNLTGTSMMAPEITAYNGAQKLVKQFLRHAPSYTGYPEVVVEWPDGGIPDVTKKAWHQLIQDLKLVKGHVLIHCAGGHGRTGTLLAILVSLGKITTGDPVTWVREQYCGKTIETEKQMTYLKKVIHIKTKATPRYMSSVPMTGLNSDIPGQLSPSLRTEAPIGPWWVRETQALTEPENLSGLYRCNVCMRHKTRDLMSHCNAEGIGCCYVCSGETDHFLERY